jgi:hypothetical protein
MTEVAGVLLEHVEQYAFERCWVRTFPAGTWFAYLGEVMASMMARLRSACA